MRETRIPPAEVSRHATMLLDEVLTAVLQPGHDVVGHHMELHRLQQIQELAEADAAEDPGARAALVRHLVRRAAALRDEAGGVSEAYADAMGRVLEAICHWEDPGAKSVSRGGARELAALLCPCLALGEMLGTTPKVLARVLHAGLRAALVPHAAGIFSPLPLRRLLLLGAAQAALHPSDEVRRAFCGIGVLVLRNGERCGTDEPELVLKAARLACDLAVGMEGDADDEVLDALAVACGQHQVLGEQLSEEWHRAQCSLGDARAAVGRTGLCRRSRLARGTWCSERTWREERGA